MSLSMRMSLAVPLGGLIDPLKELATTAWTLEIKSPRVVDSFLASVELNE